MAEYIGKELSPRHGIEFREIPTIRGSIRGGSVVVHYRDSYGHILDCVYEMADQIAASNGVSVESAIDTVCKDEGWRVIPKHRKAIAKRINQESPT